MKHLSPKKPLLMTPNALKYSINSISKMPVQTKVTLVQTPAGLISEPAVFLTDFPCTDSSFL
ncbi:hypothetical protein BGI30_11115 [Snodgrassella alvi]|nr:hypothetical protein BGI30_11115 [Snodgrassella alvi]PIT57133.1 hypothetical protein BHC59_06460 [Snodgrassella alvi]